MKAREIRAVRGTGLLGPSCRQLRAFGFVMRRRFPPPVRRARATLVVAIVSNTFTMDRLGGWSTEANMPHVGPVLEGRTFFCPHCGALYSATPSLVPKSEGDTAKCVVCLKPMGKPDTLPSFKLLQRPEDD